MSDIGEPERSDYVVDASVAVKLFIEDPLSERAYALFELITREQPVLIYVPDLFFIECTNVMWKYVRWDGLSLDSALANLSDLARLGLSIVSTADLMLESLKLAHQQTISVYDACYAALAARCSAPFVTADEKLARNLPGSILLNELGAIT